MTKTLNFLAALLLAIPLFAQAQRTYTQPELDQMLAPIALYPDALLEQVLVAAAYPGTAALAEFPQLRARMEEQPEWARALGEAYLAQEPQVMDTVQQLRQRAQAAGSLQPGEQLRVEQQGEAIVLLPAAPQLVYVPYYDPRIVYGAWWWPAYQPVHWAPWPGYRRAWHPGVSGQFWWSAPVVVHRHFHARPFHARPLRERPVVLRPVREQPVQVRPVIVRPVREHRHEHRHEQRHERRQHRQEQRRHRG